MICSFEVWAQGQMSHRRCGYLIGQSKKRVNVACAQVLSNFPSLLCCKNGVSSVCPPFFPLFFKSENWCNILVCPRVSQIGCARLIYFIDSDSSPRRWQTQANH